MLSSADMEQDLSESEDRLYRDREIAREVDGVVCSADITLTPDVEPVTPAEKCDEPSDTPPAVFLPPNLPPAVPVDINLLPRPILVYSREATAACAPGQVELSGADPYPFVVGAGADVQEVYLDDISPAIPQAELFRLANYTADLQAYVTANLIAAITLGVYTTFDAGLVALTKTTPAVASNIRSALVVAQERADEIAEAAAMASIICGWRSLELWVVCSEEEPGYTVHYSVPDAPYSYSPPGAFTSEESQEAANLQAAVFAAFSLACLVTNDETTVTCADEDLLDQTVEISWPTDWDLPELGPDGNPVTKTLEDQGAATWDAARWEDFENDLQKLQINDLNGQEFMQLAQVGADRRRVGTDRRRVLRTTVVIPAGNPSTAAFTKQEANEIAYNLAAAQLDCFVPNRPRVVSCLTETYGSTAAVARATALGLASAPSDRNAIYTEMLGGDVGTYGGPEYSRYNYGVSGYGTLLEEVDDTLAFEVRVWPGLLDGITESEADESAGRYAASYLQCLWISPEHRCACLGNTYDTAQTWGELPTDASDMSSAFNESVTEVGSAEDVKLDTARSRWQNTIPRGLILSDTYPNAGTSYAGAYRWPELPQMCQSSLSCLFVSCKIACCEPKPDERPTLANEMPNWASTQEAWLAQRPANQSDHLAFMNNWRSELSSRSLLSCALATPFAPIQYDDCALPTDGDPEDSASSILPGIDLTGSGAKIVHPGPNDGAGPGMPARFKYGGLLPWGRHWSEPSISGDPGDPGNLSARPGRVKACQTFDVDHPPLTTPSDEWGFYHCAEGVAEGFSPEGLAEQARSAALSRLDCTHIAWPRHMTNCPQPGQHGFGSPRPINIMTEGSSTGEADQASEMMLISMMGCRDAHNFGIAFGGGDGGGSLSLPGPSVAVVGKDECMPIGLSEATLYEDDCKTLAVTSGVSVSGGGHIFIVARCCPDQDAKRLIYIRQSDSGVTAVKIRTALQKSELGIEEGRTMLETLREVEDGEVYYIGSYHVTHLGDDTYESIAVQAHSGPVLLSNTCCGSSSGSSDSSSSGSSDGSSTDGSVGPSSGGSNGSDKSTAIVPAAWSPHGYTALFTMESPEVLFIDWMRDIPIRRGINIIPIDPKFASVCEKNTLRAFCSSDNPAPLGVSVKGENLIIKAPFFSRRSIAQVAIFGKRRGFLHLRLPDRDKEQFDANERTLNSAYPAKNL